MTTRGKPKEIHDTALRSLHCRRKLSSTKKAPCATETQTPHDPSREKELSTPPPPPRSDRERGEKRYTIAATQTNSSRAPPRPSESRATSASPGDYEKPKQFHGSALQGLRYAGKSSSTKWEACAINRQSPRGMSFQSLSTALFWRLDEQHTGAFLYHAFGRARKLDYKLLVNSSDGVQIAYKNPFSTTGMKARSESSLKNSSLHPYRV